MIQLKPQKTVLYETGRLAAGVFALVAVMLCVYAVAGQLKWSAALGGVYTGALAVLNFFIMGLTVQNVTNTASGKKYTEEEMESLKKTMKAKMQLSYSGRMVLMMVLVVVGISALKLDPLATIIPLLFPRLVITVLNIKGQSGSPKGSAKE